MKRRFSFGACIILMLITAIFTYQITDYTLKNQFAKQISYISKTPSADPKLAEAKYYVENYFVKEYDEDYVDEATVLGYILGLKDPHSSYYTKEQFAELQESTNGNATGIGIRVFKNLNTQEMIVYEVTKGSPAEKAGIQKGDAVYSVNGKSYDDLTFDGAYLELLGEEGESVEVSFRRGEEIVDFTIIRSHFEQQTVSYKLCETDSSIGYIKIHSFDISTNDQFKNAVEELLESGVESFIFDVRSNPGGTLDSVSKILDYLLPAGPIIRMVDKNGDSEILQSDSAELSARMVVLANDSSASAAELFTSALMDYNKATFIGTTTYGKGTVQSTFKLSDGSGIRISTQYYLPPFSASFDGVGIEPDITVELSEESLANYYILSESEDEQLATAIEYLKQ